MAVRSALARPALASLAALGLAVTITAAGAAGAAPEQKPKPKPKPATHTVTMSSTSFAPADLTVKAGDTVVWMNKDFFPHTATSKSGGFDSSDIVSGKSWKYVAKKKGDFPYICSIHPTMKGTLHVK
jgi:plastocyanin